MIQEEVAEGDGIGGLTKKKKKINKKKKKIKLKY
jgi:hypothetical protein